MTGLYMYGLIHVFIIKVSVHIALDQNTASQSSVLDQSVVFVLHLYGMFLFSGSSWKNFGE